MPINRFNQMRKWLFKYGTRVVELLNAVMLFAFATVFILNSSRLLKLPIYEAFADISTPMWWWGIGGLGIIQIVFMVLPSLRACQLSGYALLVSSAVWAFIAMTFYVPESLNTAVFMYGTLSVLCLLAGYELMQVNYSLEMKRGQENGSA